MPGTDQTLDTWLVELVKVYEGWLEPGADSVIARFPSPDLRDRFLKALALYVAQERAALQPQLPPPPPPPSKVKAVKPKTAAKAAPKKAPTKKPKVKV